MRRIHYIKIALDLLMALLFVLFFNTHVLGGQPFHEIAGLVFAVMYLTHILLSAPWVFRITRRLFDRKLRWRTRGTYVLNLLLLISMTFVIISGVLISRVVFPTIHVADQEWFRLTHISVSYFVLMIMGIHVGLHWQWILNVWNKIWHYRPRKSWIRYGARALTLLILLFGLFQMNQSGFVDQLSGVTSVFGIHTQSMHGYDGRPFDGAAHGDGFPSHHQDFFQFRHHSQGDPNNFQFSGDGFRFDGRQANALKVISTYMGMMAVFVIIVYYLNKVIRRTKKKTMSRQVV